LSSGDLGNARPNRGCRRLVHNPTIARSQGENFYPGSSKGSVRPGHSVESRRNRKSIARFIRPSKRHYSFAIGAIWRGDSEVRRHSSKGDCRAIRHRHSQPINCRPSFRLDRPHGLSCRCSTADCRPGRDVPADSLNGSIPRKAHHIARPFLVPNTPRERSLS